MGNDELRRIAERLARGRTELKDLIDSATSGENSAKELLSRVHRLQERLESTLGVRRKRETSKRSPR